MSILRAPLSPFKFWLYAACLFAATADILFAASQNADDSDDDAPKASLITAPGTSRDINLNGNISIEENMRLRRDLYEYSKAVDPAHVQIEERRRVMHQRLQTRFQEADKDNDGSISRIEAFELLPQIARHFTQVDLNSDNVITLDELETAQAKFIESQRAVQETPPIPASQKIKTTRSMATNKRAY